MASCPSTVPFETPATGLVIWERRPADMVAFEAEVVAFFVDAASLLGGHRLVAAIFGMCFASPNALDFVELEARLELSKKGSVSQGLKVLREVGALKDAATQDARAWAYMPDTELRQLVGQFLATRVWRQLEGGHRRNLDLKRGLSAFPAPAQRALRVRVTKLERWQTRARALPPVAKTILRLGV